MKKKIVALMTVGSILLVPALSLAADTDVSITVNPGTLSISAPGSADMTAVDLDTIPDTGTTSTGTISTIKVKDHRSGAAAGWTASYTVTDFSDGGTNSIDVTELSASPSNLAAIASTSLTGVSLGSGGALADSNADGTSDAYTLVSATSGNGQGRITCDLDLSLNIDISTAPAAYTATVVATVV